MDELDIIHDQCVQAVQTSLGKLFGPGTTFQGEGATAVANLMGDYFDHESKLSNYSTNGISEYMVQLEQLCSSTIQQMEPHLEAVSSFNSSNVLLGDIIHYWSDVFQKGPQALIDGLQVGPWSMGQVEHFLSGQPGAGPQVQSSQQLQMQQPLQQPGPQGQTPVSGFWDIVAAILAPFAALIIVVNIITEIIKQFSLDWHMESLAFLAWQWVSQMNSLHDHILMQNSSTNPSGNVGSIHTALKNEAANFMLKRVCHLPGPNLSPEQNEFAKQLYAVAEALYPGVLTLTEVQYLVQYFPKDVAERKVFMLAELKTMFPKLPDGYLAFFVLQGLSMTTIVQDVQWLQTAAANTQGKGPGNIYYMQGSALTNPYVDFVTAETYRYEAQSANQLRAWQNQVLNGQMTLTDIANLPDDAVKAFLMKTYRYKAQLANYNPNIAGSKLPDGYDGLFGTAVQEMVKANIRTAPWVRNEQSYLLDNNLLLDKSDAAGQRPDIQLQLSNGQWAAFDYTTYNQLGSKKKYNRSPYNFNIVLIHNGPFGKDEILTQG